MINRLVSNWATAVSGKPASRATALESTAREPLTGSTATASSARSITSPVIAWIRSARRELEPADRGAHEPDALRVRVAAVVGQLAAQLPGVVGEELGGIDEPDLGAVARVGHGLDQRPAQFAEDLDPLADRPLDRELRVS